MSITGKVSKNCSELKSTKYNNKYIRIHHKYINYCDSKKYFRAFIIKLIMNYYSDLTIKYFKKEVGLWKKI